MGVVLYNLVTAWILMLAIKAGRTLTVRRQGVPWLAIFGTRAMVAGLVLQATWSGAMDALDSDPSRWGWWRPVTSVFLQNGGFLGDVWNLVTAPIVLALAEWHWGRLRTLALLAGAVFLPRLL